MSIFEIQIMSDGRWMADDAFEDYDSAYKSAERIERRRQPDQLRIRRIDLVRPGITRERTMYDGGQKVRRERASERTREGRDAFRQRIADRRVSRTMAENAARQKNGQLSRTGPVYLTVVSLSLFLTGLSAIYFVEKAFSSY